MNKQFYCSKAGDIVVNGWIKGSSCGNNSNPNEFLHRFHARCAVCNWRLILLYVLRTFLCCLLNCANILQWRRYRLCRFCTVATFFFKRADARLQRARLMMAWARLVASIQLLRTVDGSRHSGHSLCPARNQIMIQSVQNVWLHGSVYGLLALSEKQIVHPLIFYTIVY